MAGRHGNKGVIARILPVRGHALPGRRHARRHHPQPDRCAEPHEHRPGAGDAPRLGRHAASASAPSRPSSTAATRRRSRTRSAAPGSASRPARSDRREPAPRTARTATRHRRRERRRREGPQVAARTRATTPTTVFDDDTVGEARRVGLELWLESSRASNAALRRQVVPRASTAMAEKLLLETRRRRRRSTASRSLLDGRTGEPLRPAGHRRLHLHAQARPPGRGQDPRPLHRPVLAHHPAAAGWQGAVRRPALRRDGGVGARGLRRRAHPPGAADREVRRRRRPREDLRSHRQGRGHPGAGRARSRSRCSSRSSRASASRWRS